MIILKILATILLTFASGWLYRAGGTGYPFNRWYRRIGVPICAILTMFLWFIMPCWCWTGTALLMVLSMTTYCKIDGNENVDWYEWLLAGAMYGLTPVLYAWQSGNWLGFGIRTVFLALFTMIWSVLIDDVEFEERGRGWGFNGSLPLLLI